MKSKTIKVIIAGSLFVLPVFAFAQVQSFTPLVGIPGLTDGELNFNTYINTLYTLSISIAGLLAVIKIIIAGVKYMLSDVVTNKQEAIGDIKGALLGLLIVLAAVVVLNTINPQLTRSTLSLTDASQAPGGATGGQKAPVTPIETVTSVKICNNTDCTAAKLSCTKDGGTSGPVLSIKDNAPVPGRINCKKPVSGT